VEELAARAAGDTRVFAELLVGEATLEEVEAHLIGIDGVLSAEARRGDTSMHIALTAAGDRDVRADVFGMAKARGWTLLELRHERGSLEDLFRTITAAGVQHAPELPEAA
jgi:hypothetical protein